MYGLDNIRYQPHGMLSWLAKRSFRLILGLTFVYVGVDLAADIVRSDAGANKHLKNLVYRYDAINITESVISDVGNALLNSFGDSKQSISSAEVNVRTQQAASSLTTNFKNQMPHVHAALDDIISSVISSFREPISEELKKH